ncbi:scavenger receptor cysteine-rich domain-containing protein DMBT1-like [Branchiostoma floridae x Branchiostoma japonicum]
MKMWQRLLLAFTFLLDTRVRSQPPPPTGSATPSPSSRIRLVGGFSPNEGRVEVRPMDSFVWGTVCDNSFGFADAIVICRMLGYPGYQTFYHGAYFGQGTGPIYMDDLGCTGVETSVFDCSYRGWGNHNCTHRKDANVVCSTSTTMSYTPARGTGSYFICYNGQQVDWSLRCNGFMNCSDGSDEMNCVPVPLGSSTTVTATPSPSSRIRLVGGSSPNEGRVEVRPADSVVWGTVCDDNFEFNDATVICRMLGYPGYETYHHDAHFGQGTGPIYMDDLHCTGMEISLFDCPYSGWGSHNCGHHEDVSVDCLTSATMSPSTPSPSSRIRLVGGSSPNEGRVEVRPADSYLWGTVCDDSFGINDGNVACRMLGYTGVDQVRNYAYFGQGTGEIYMDDLQCTGTERSLFDCRYSGWMSHNCGHNEDAGVVCFGYTTTAPIGSRFRCLNLQQIDFSLRCNGITDCTDDSDEMNCISDTGISDRNRIRLVGGSAANEGRLEVRPEDGGDWGTVCDDNFNTDDAIVACKTLGYRTAHQVYTKAHFGQGSGTIYLDNVQCSGHETSLFNCGHSGWGVHNCGHSEDVGIACDSSWVCDNGNVIHAPENPFCDGLVTCTDNSDESPTRCPYEEMYNVCGSTKMLSRAESGYITYSISSSYPTYIKCKVVFQTEPNHVIRVGPWYLDGMSSTCSDWISVCDGGDLSRCDLDNNNVRYCNGFHLQTFQSSGSSLTVNLESDGYKISEENFKIFYTVKSVIDIVGDRIRLVGGPFPNLGRVEVRPVGSYDWGTVCDDNFDIQDATVVCRMLGYGRAVQYHSGAYFGQGSGNIYMDGLQCSGSEASLFECAYNGWGVNNCGHNEDVGVTCEATNGDDNSRIRLVEGSSSNEGRVEVRPADGYDWGTVCDDEFDHDDATVVCRMLGYSSASAVHNKAYFGQGTGPIYMDDLECTGSETSLFNCAYRGWGIENCGHSEDVGVVCGTNGQWACDNGYQLSDFTSSPFCDGWVNCPDQSDEAITRCTFEQMRDFCGQTSNLLSSGTSGYLVYAYDRGYPANARCTVNLRTESDHVLRIGPIDLTQMRDCSDKIYFCDGDEPCDNYNSQREFCGGIHDHSTFVSAGNMLTLTLLADGNSITDENFKIFYKVERIYSGPSGGTIAGIVVGVLVSLGVVGAGIYHCKKKRSSDGPSQTASQNIGMSPTGVQNSAFSPEQQPAFNPQYSPAYPPTGATYPPVYPPPPPYPPSSAPLPYPPSTAPLTYPPSTAPPLYPPSPSSPPPDFPPPPAYEDALNMAKSPPSLQPDAHPEEPSPPQSSSNQT